MKLSVVMPVLNESACLESLLEGLRKRLGDGDEIIVVDGCSTDDSALIAGRHADLVLHCDRGRARQMNLGAERASGDLLWFLHADCGRVLSGHVRALRTLADDALWGRFDVRLSGEHPMLFLIGHAMNLRSRWTGIATGDQGIFIRRDLFQELGGFPEQPLMEDIALSRRLCARTPPVCLRPRLVADSRRWESRGVWRTTLLMWQLRWRYWRGEDPARLHRDYYGS
ncbi:glycosyl transferase [Alcanivorax sp. N3-2A]|nr:glycosyl transferase [Alcanivorax sp. N3-2A]|tara:strand:- start:45110 stop:45787 length:678 start_codon:yes stop_codon:yes gene_type:complete